MRLFFRCRAYLKDLKKIAKGFSPEQFEKVLAKLPASDDEQFAEILNEALTCREIDRYEPEEIAKEFGVSPTTAISWSKGERLPHPDIQKQIVKWFIKTERIGYHCIRYNNKLYLAEGCSPEQVAKQVLPDVDISSDEHYMYRNLGRYRPLALRTFKELEEEIAAEVKQDAFDPKELSIRGAVKPITHLWQIINDRGFREMNRDLCWPAFHPKVHPRSLPRLYASREDAEFLCEPVARKSASRMGSEEGEQWDLDILREESRTVYLARNPDDEDDVWAIGWVKRVEFVA